MKYQKHQDPAKWIFHLTKFNHYLYCCLPKGRWRVKVGKCTDSWDYFASMLINNSLQKRAGGEWLRSLHTAGDKQPPPPHLVCGQKHTFNTLIPISLHKQTDYPALLSSWFKHNDHTHTHTHRHIGRDVTVSKMAGSYISVGMGIYSWLVLISQLMPCLI